MATTSESSAHIFFHFLLFNCFYFFSSSPLICFIPFSFFLLLRYFSARSLASLKMVVVTHRSVGKAVENYTKHSTRSWHALSSSSFAPPSRVTQRLVSTTCTTKHWAKKWPLYFTAPYKTITELPNLHHLVVTLHFTAIDLTTRNVLVGHRTR